MMEIPAGITLWFPFLVILVTFLFLHRRKSKLPPGPTGIPILGYLPFLSENPHLDLVELSKKYGNVFGLYLGMTYTVVVTDYNIAKDLFKQYSTSDRPPNLFHLLPGGVGFAELNGPEWVEQRRHSIQTLKNLRFGGSNFEKLIQLELSSFLDSLASYEGQPIEIHEPLFTKVSTNIVSLMLGHPLSPTDNPEKNAQEILRPGIEGFVRSHNQSGVINLFPKLCKICMNLGIIKGKEHILAMKRMHKYVRDTFLKHHSAEENSYVYEYLKEVEKNEKKSFNVANLIGNAQALILAGSDTTSESLLWLFLAMAAHQDVQDKVQGEIDKVLGKQEQVKWEDRRRLPFCHASMLEAQRWRTIAPLNVLHMTNQDVPVGNYIIPKGSSILALISAYHTDPEKWENPEEYRPERLLDDQGAVLKTIDNFAPFSFGKRVCIGETIAYIEIFLFFVSTLQRFRILPPTDGQTLDLSGKLGIVYQPVSQTLRFVQRSADS